MRPTPFAWSRPRRAAGSRRGADTVAAYRSGRRLFAWREGEFDPDSSFGLVEAGLAANYPDPSATGAELRDLAECIVEEIRGGVGEVYADGEWNRLRDSLKDVLTFQARSLAKFGNGELSWTSGWWRCAELMSQVIFDELHERASKWRDPQTLAFAAAGLPGPSGSTGYVRLNPDKYASTVDERWTSQELARAAVRELESLEGGTGLSALNWAESYRQHLLVEGHPAVALMTHGVSAAPGVRAAAWSRVTEDQFLGLLASGPPGGIVAFCSGRALGGPGRDADENPAWIVPCREATIEPDGSGGARVVFPDWTFAVPLARELAEGYVPDLASAPHVDCKPLVFTARTVTVVDGRLLLKGQLGLTLKARGTWPTALVTAASRDDESGELSGKLGRGASCRLFLPDPWRSPASLVVLRVKRRLLLAVAGGGAFRVDAGHVVPEETWDADKLVVRSESMADVWSYDWSPGKTGAELLRSGEVCGEVDTEWTGLSKLSNVSVADGKELEAASEAGRIRLAFNVEDRSAKAFSPLVAAALGGLPRPLAEGVPHEAKSDMRGELETLFAAGISSLLGSDQPPGGGLWQVAVPSGAGHAWRPTVLHEGPAVKLFTEQGPSLGVLTSAGDGPTPDLLASSECREFWAALKAIAETIRDQWSAGTPGWLGRCTLRDVPREAVDRYLAAYTRLVERGAPLRFDRFWSRYPFSVVVFDPSNRNVLAVMLSPLHPLRLGWQFAVERALLESHDRLGSSAALLAQVVEGWNIPWMGPAPAPSGEPLKTLVAVPTDPGPEQLFLGWSLVAHADGTAPVLPVWAGGRRLPSGAGSGLNQAGVVAALKDFLRINAHLSTLVLDLSAFAPGARASELDQAVIEASAVVARERGASFRLHGGVRVYDSLNRLGQPPSAENAIARLGDDDSGEPPPFEWRRYGPDNAPASHVRLVEDSRVAISRVSGQEWGVMPEWPVRRFIARTSDDNGMRLNGCVKSRPGAWEPFIGALSAFEAYTAEPPALEVAMLDVLGAAADNTEWTVTGNVFVDPASFAKELASHGQILWEWRPAFLGRPKSLEVPLLSARPYTTVARLPEAFKRAVQSKAGLSEERASAVFRTLGERGVGLASLVTMEANKVWGALGFFLGFRLLEHGTPPATTRLVVPLDAVDQFLRAIAGDQADLPSKRADLLVVEIRLGDQPSLTLVPVEIRCSGSEGTGNFPGETTDAVLEKVGQLADTLSTLAAVVDRVRVSPTAGVRAADRVLELSALGCLVECGLMLTPGAPSGQLAAELLGLVVSGAMDVRVGRGILLWFQCGAGQAHRWCEATPDDRTGILFVDYSQEADELWGNAEGALVAAARRALDWSSAVQLPSTPRHPVAIDYAAAQHGHAVAPVVAEPVGDNAASTASVDPATVRPPSNHLAVEVGRRTDRPGAVTWEPYHPASRLNNAHVVILGSSGSGKTQTLKAFLYEAKRQGTPVLVLDFKDDYVDDGFLESIGASCYYAEDGLPVSPLKLEPDSRGRISVHGQVFQLADTLKRVHGLGDIQVSKLRDALFGVYEAAGIPRDSTKLPEGCRQPAFNDLESFLDLQGDDRLSARLSPLFQLGLFDRGTLSLRELIGGSTVVRLTQLPGDQGEEVRGRDLLRSPLLGPRGHGTPRGNPPHAGYRRGPPGGQP